MSDTASVSSLFTVPAHEAGADLEIIDPRTGKPHGLVLTLVGVDSDTYRAADAKLFEARVAAQKKQMTPNETYNELAERLAHCTKGWSGVEEEFSHKAAFELYRNSPPVFEQASAFVLDKANFYRD